MILLHLFADKISASVFFSLPPQYRHLCHWVVFLAVCPVCLWPLTIQAQEADRVLELRAGFQDTLEFPGAIQRTAVAGAEIVEVSVLDDNSLLVTGLSPGLEVLRVWLAGSNQPRQVEIRVLPASVAELDPAYSLSLSPDQNTLHGESRALDEHARTLSYLGDGVVDNTWQQGVQVQTDIRVVEVNKRLLQSSGFFIGRDSPGSASFGIGRSDSVLSFLSGGTPTLAGGEFSVIRANTSGVMSAVSALRGNGFATVLAEPSVVSLSGQSAAFLVGGEFPVPVRARDDQVTIEYKEYGVRLQLTPTVLDEDRIVLKVAPEVSELDFNNAVQTSGVAVPSLNVRRTDTTVQLGDGESFIISGLISNNTSQNTEGIPGLDDLPLLGALFRSTRFERDETELIMIVTPHLVKPIAAGTDLGDMPGDALRRYKPSFLELILDPKDANYIEQNTDIGFSR